MASLTLLPSVSSQQQTPHFLTVQTAAHSKLHWTDLLVLFVCIGVQLKPRKAGENVKKKKYHVG